MISRQDNQNLGAKGNRTYKAYGVYHMVSLIILLCVAAIFYVSAENNVDWNNPEQFNANFENDPAAAFSNNPEMVWNKIENNPLLLADNEQVMTAAFNNNQDRFWEIIGKTGSDVMKRPQLWDFAFKQDRLKAAGVIENNPHILDDSVLLEKFDLEISSPELRNGKSGVEIINENPKAKKTWLEKKYGLFTEDIIETGGKIKNAEILKYDGNEITTGGAGGATFTVKDVKGAKILTDGSLEFKNAVIKATKSFSLKTDEYGNDYYGMEKGEVYMDEKVKDILLKITGGKVFSSGKGSVTYDCSDCAFEKGARMGQFIKSEETGDLIRGKFKRIGHYQLDNPYQAAVTMEVDGGLFQPDNSNPEEMVILGKTKLVKKELIFGDPNKNYKTTLPGDGTVINIEGPNPVYYTEKKSRDAAKFCRDDFACIVDTPGQEYGSAYKERLAFLNAQENDKISVNTPVYYNRVEVLDQVGGEVTFASVNKRSGTVLGEIKSVAGEKPKLVRGRLEEIKSGRFDVLDSTDPYEPPLLHHWSSKKFQKERTYFTSKRDHFATCNYDSDCEEVFAKEFGKVILPKNPAKKISTTIVVSGDNANTPLSMLSYCLKEGCYIVNSRDSPPTTRSSKLVVTGHHYEGSDYVWRDPPESFKNHNPIDKLYFSPVEGGSPLDSLPTSSADSLNPVDYIAFSACNTANSYNSADFEILQKKYPDLKIVQGWRNKAPLHETISDLPTSIDEMEKLAQGSIVKNKYGAEIGGEKSWYIKRADGSWRWTNGRVNPQPLGDLYE